MLRHEESVHGDGGGGIDDTSYDESDHGSGDPESDDDVGDDSDGSQSGSEESNASESDIGSDGGDNGDVEDDDSGEIDLWSHLKRKAMQKITKDNNSAVANGMSEEEVMSDISRNTLPTIRQKMMDSYTRMLLLWHYANRDPVNKKIINTKRRLIDEEDYDPDEAIRYAVHKRRYLIYKATDTLENADSTDEDIDGDADEENATEEDTPIENFRHGTYVNKFAR